MDTWLERANRCGDVPSYSESSLIYVQAGLAADIKSKIIKALMAGTAIGAIMAGLGVDGPRWEDYISSLNDEISVTDDYLENTMEPVQLDSSVMDIPTTPVSTPSSPADIDYKTISSYIGGHEGFENHVYNDSYGHPTVGVGHKIVDESTELFNELFGGAVDAVDVANGNQDLTDPQVISLFAHDVQAKLAVARRLFPLFDSYNTSTQAALLNGVYRGEHRARYRTTELINAGRWAEAADEYLRNNEYIDAKAGVERGDNTTNAGIVPRMEENAEIIRSNAN